MMQPGEFIMPVGSEEAGRRFEIEAIRQLSENMRQTAEGLRDLRSEIANDRVVMMDIRDRMIRIESNSVETRVASLESKVDTLERDRDRRDGAASLFNWLVSNWPALVGFFVLIAIVLKSTGKI